MSDSPNVTRKLAAIMFTDIVGFTKIMAESEDTAFSILKNQDDIVNPLMTKFNGNLIKKMGDGLLISFKSAIQAAQCSLEIQSKVEYIENLNYRIGIHVGDVIKVNNDVIGDGVNIASRIQGLCEVGEICISKVVYDAITSHPEMQCTLLGSKALKGITEKIEIYKLVVFQTNA